LGVIFPLIEVPSQEYSIATAPLAAQMTGAWLAALALPTHQRSQDQADCRGLV
jgi:hypothetical protein